MKIPGVKGKVIVIIPAVGAAEIVTAMTTTNTIITTIVLLFLTL